MARYDLVILHTTVGSFEGTDGYFRRLTNGVNSHFLTGGYGEIRQLVDTAVRSGANGAGNHRSITIENADMGPGFPAWDTRNGSAVPAFTPAQIEANAQICAWAHITHGVPLVAADTSRPSARGIGYHRLGCNPWRVPDGEVWSSANGKVCPGPRRIAQIPQIIARAIEIVNGDDDVNLDDPIGNANPYVKPGSATTVRNLLMDTQANAAYAARQTAGLSAALDAMTKLVAQQNGLNLEDVRAAVREEMAAGVHVTVGGAKPDA